jgi:hypothetical protein
LRLIGREPAPKGIFEVAHMPAVIAALESAVAQDEAARQDDGADEPARGKGDGVTLRQRVWPLVDLLKRAQAAREPITWGT